jgi:hypothetical protein
VQRILTGGGHGASWRRRTTALRRRLDTDDKSRIAPSSIWSTNATGVFAHTRRKARPDPRCRTAAGNDSVAASVVWCGFAALIPLSLARQWSRRQETGEGRGACARTLWTSETTPSERNAGWWLEPPARGPRISRAPRLRLGMDLASGASRSVAQRSARARFAADGRVPQVGTKNRSWAAR